jgi:hypothetical protein
MKQECYHDVWYGGGGGGGSNNGSDNDDNDSYNIPYVTYKKLQEINDC